MKRRKKIVPGSLMKALIRPGGGDSRPSDGDQVMYHCTIRTLDGVVVESSRSENKVSRGTPIRHVLGKSKMIVGLLEGIPTMLKREVVMLFQFKMKPLVHYGEDDCPVSVVNEFLKDDELHFEIEMIDFFKAKARVVKRLLHEQVINEGQGWGSPRDPYEVKAWISAKIGDGKLILSHMEGEPYFFTFGKSKVPKGLEMGIGTMARGEKAVAYVPSQYLTQSPLILVIVLKLFTLRWSLSTSFRSKAWDMLGDGRLIKCRIHDGKGEFPMDCPLYDSLLHVHYKGMLLNEERRVFYDTRVDNNDQPLEFSSGEGLDWTGLNLKSIMDDAEKIRLTGNRLFKEGKFELAKAKYEKVLRKFNYVNPQDDDEGKEFENTRNLHLNVAACQLKLGECRKSIETCNKVLDANPAHVKALYRRGMAYMEAGDFEEARGDFKMVMLIIYLLDKSSEADATAAFLKLKQKEQEVEKKARKQFIGLFDKKPGEITVAGAEDEEDIDTGENHNNFDKEDSDANNSEESREAAADERQRGWFSLFWPSSGRLFSALGLQRCSIL
ncbi:hypothetical protein SO802_031407 [Lithocarpus litseifolius]|uniref:peptidylprolyl isomerase n=1 Tax=Lithocarpus litseifolius TaxID=425828 RepID=A0AAW2BM92_9ROSI